MADFAFSVLWKLASSALQLNSLPWGEIKKFKETISTIEAVLEDVEERQTNSEDLGIWLKKLEDVLLKASKLLNEIEDEVQLRSQDSAGRKLCRFFSSSNPLVFCFRIGHRINEMIERIDKILAGRGILEMPDRSRTHAEAYSRRHRPKLQDVVDVVERIKGISGEIIDRIDKRSCFGDIGRDDDCAKPIAYVVACIVGVCVDPFFLYIPFLSHTKMCLGMNRELWKVVIALRTVADFFTALILLPQLSRCMSSIKLILLMCVKYLALAPIPQILLSEMFILKTLGGYTFWNLILFCLYGARLVLIFQVCEQLKGMISARTLVTFNGPVYLFLYLIISHVIGASWYYLSIKRQLSCWNHACKFDTGCVHNVFPCDGTTPSTLNSTLVTEVCPLNPEKFGIYLDALQSGIVEDKGVLKKFLQCFFWGLRNLSSFASNLYSSTNDGETFFAIIISTVGLILLIYILQNIRVGFPVESRSANSATERVDSSNPVQITDEGASIQGSANSATERVDSSNSVQITDEGASVQGSANAATERVDSSNRTMEGSSVQRTEEGASVQSANSATHRVYSSNRTVEGSSIQRTEEGASIQRTGEIEMSNPISTADVNSHLLMILKASIRKRITDLATEGVDSSSQTEEDGSEQIEIKVL